MLCPDTFRFSQELEVLEGIRAHPALPDLKTRLQGYWTDVQGRHFHVETALPPAGELLSAQEHVEVCSAVQHGLALFGATREFSLVATGSAADTYRDVVFQPQGDRLTVMIPRTVLSRLHGASLAAAIGHGLGHFLLAHDADADMAALIALARLEDLPHDGQVEELRDHPAFADLLKRAVLLSQLQDFSADRISLLVARDVMAVLTAAVRSFSDVSVTSLSHLREDSGCAIPADLAQERASRPHAAFPTRAWLLELFSTSALYREAIGLEGGIGTAELDRLSASRLPLQGDRPILQPEDLDDLVLVLILMDSLISAGRRSRPRAEAMIARYLPPGTYTQVVERYDQLSDDDDEDVNLLPWLRMAALKPSWWKVAMIERFLYLASLDRRLDDQTLGEVASLAAAMGAMEECRLICTMGFGYDPFCWSTPLLDEFTRGQDAPQVLSL